MSLPGPNEDIFVQIIAIGHLLKNKIYLRISKSIPENRSINQQLHQKYNAINGNSELNNMLGHYDLTS